jgi:hypothetical protein
LDYLVVEVFAHKGLNHVDFTPSLTTVRLQFRVLPTISTKAETRKEETLGQSITGED